MSVFDDLRVRLRNYSFTRTALTKGVWINDPVSDIDWHCNKHSWDSFCVCVYFKPLTDNVITHSIHIRPRWVTTWWVNIIITSSFWNAVPRFWIERTVSRSLLKVSGLVCKLFLYTDIQLYDVIICLINVQFNTTFSRLSRLFCIELWLQYGENICNRIFCIATCCHNKHLIL